MTDLVPRQPDATPASHAASTISARTASTHSSRSCS